MLAERQAQPWFHACSLSDGHWPSGAAASLGPWLLSALSHNCADRALVPPQQNSSREALCWRPETKWVPVSLFSRTMRRQSPLKSECLGLQMLAVAHPQGNLDILPRLVSSQNGSQEYLRVGCVWLRFGDYEDVWENCYTSLYEILFSFLFCGGGGRSWIRNRQAPATQKHILSGLSQGFWSHKTLSC